MKRKIFNIILVLISMLTIFLFSCETSKESTKTSNKVAKDVVSVVVKDPKKVDKIVDDNFNLVRKFAHFIEYLILGFLVINMLKDYYSVDYKIIIGAVLICMLYAISDEIHQIFVPGRACRLFDVLIDTVGSSLGIALYYLIYKYFHKII